VQRRLPLSASITVAKINFTGRISISPYVWISIAQKSFIFIQKSLHILILDFFGTHSAERDPEYMKDILLFNLRRVNVLIQVIFLIILLFLFFNSGLTGTNIPSDEDVVFWSGGGDNESPVVVSRIAILTIGAWVRALCH